MDGGGPVIRPLRDGEEAALTALWDACGLTRPWNPPARDIAFARATPTAEILVAEDTDDAGALLASVLCGHEGHRGWMYYVAVRPDRQGTGLGKRMVAAAEDWLARQGCWKVMLMVRRDNAAAQEFYAAQGYEESDVTRHGAVAGG
ncbi:putative acetyltransferase [Caenispirillum salinarum AK4]|uniref:Putative acetyltransferase n=1 Tax=Caenispirillum salinarum AK4 TaxID=1238182 RepID=K9GTC6_9PROT|nr:GNAT family acetyltransferase [Caenispirillum salinarum]EKV28442.1 putative acetyltransferase [Caenispirillum salinarum AK4]